MAPLVGALLSYGPSLIRTIGSLFGGKSAEAANQVADVVDSVKGLPNEIAQAKLNEKLAALPPETMLAFKQVEVRLAEIDRDREANRLRAETDQQAQEQQTRRAEIESDDSYVRRTRPTIARQSFWVGVAYLAFCGACAVLKGIYGWNLPSIQEWIVMAIWSPLLSYIGSRGVEAFSRNGKS